MRYEWIAAVAALIAASALPAAAAEQKYPTRPIRMLVPFTPGSQTDILARWMGEKVTESSGQQVVVDNRPGANAILGLEALKASPPDGYTLAAASAGPLAVNPFIYAKLPQRDRKSVV